MNSGSTPRIHESTPGVKTPRARKSASTARTCARMSVVDTGSVWAGVDPSGQAASSPGALTAAR